eukprot:COSAG02_NODE_39933_length_411_cov_0.660256_1_plen_78_part_01
MFETGTVRLYLTVICSLEQRTELRVYSLVCWRLGKIEMPIFMTVQSLLVSRLPLATVRYFWSKFEFVAENTLRDSGWL